MRVLCHTCRCKIQGKTSSRSPFVVLKVKVRWKRKHSSVYLQRLNTASLFCTLCGVHWSTLRTTKKNGVLCTVLFEWVYFRIVYCDSKGAREDCWIQNEKMFRGCDECMAATWRNLRTQSNRLSVFFGCLCTQFGMIVTVFMQGLVSTSLMWNFRAKNVTTTSTTTTTM